MDECAHNAIRPEAGRRRWRSLAAVVSCALIACGAAAWREGAMERRAVADVSAPAERAAPVNTARVLGAIRELKLVTVTITTHVNAESSEESWRGDVRADVDAPVKLHFGTDLSRVVADGLRASPLGTAWVVTVPAPERIATEVLGQLEETDVHVGWLRARSISGEKHLGLARRGLYPAAQSLRLSTEDEQRVRAVTREQVAAMVRAIVGDRASVSVRFEDEGGWLRPRGDGG